MVVILSRGSGCLARRSDPAVRLSSIPSIRQPRESHAPRSQERFQIGDGNCVRVDAEGFAGLEETPSAAGVADAQEHRTRAGRALENAGHGVDRLRPVSHNAQAEYQPLGQLTAGLLHAQNPADHQARLLARSLDRGFDEADAVLVNVVLVAKVVVRPHDALDAAGEVLELAAE